MPPAPDEIAAEKAAIRTAALARRDALSMKARANGSEAIGERLMEVGIRPQEVVSAFLPIRTEVDLRPTIAHLFTVGCRIGLPIMRKPDLVFREWIPDAPLVPLGFGTVGPDDTAPEVVPDVMLVPLSAFDRTGARIGYGRAFYDITIAGLRAAGRDPRLIGVAFSVQEAPRVPVEPHDVPLHLVVTEREIIVPRPAGK